MDKQRWLQMLSESERGATAVEYGLIAALIVIAAMASINGLASTTIGMWDEVADKVSAE